MTCPCSVWDHMVWILVLLDHMFPVSCHFYLAPLSPSLFNPFHLLSSLVLPYLRSLCLCLFIVVSCLVLYVWVICEFSLVYPLFCVLPGFCSVFPSLVSHHILLPCVCYFCPLVFISQCLMCLNKFPIFGKAVSALGFCRTYHAPRL